MDKQKKIINTVKEFYGIDFTHGRLREPYYLRAKFAACILLKQNTDLRLKTIAVEIGLKTPASASHNFNRGLREQTSNPSFARQMELIEGILKNSN